MIYLAKKSFKIAGSFALALCLSRLWLNLVVMAAWWLRKRDIQSIPSCRHRCEGRRENVNTLSIFPCNGFPKSSRVSQNLTIHYSFSGVSSCSYSCAAPIGCAPLSRSRKVPYGIPYVDAAARIHGSRPVRMHVWLQESHSLCQSLRLWTSLFPWLRCCGARVEIEFVIGVINNPAPGACVFFCVIGC